MITLPLRPKYAHEKPYGAPQMDGLTALNVNENPFPPSPKLVEAIACACGEAATTLNRYPNREAGELRADLADYLAEESGVRVKAEQIWAANGSNEVLQQILQAFAGPGRTVVTFTPSYSMYPEYARNTESEWVVERRRSDFGLDLAVVRETLQRTHPAVILLASPNNPTGTALPQADLVEVLKMAATKGPEGAASIVVVDEAYAEFRREGVPSALELLARNPHLIVSRTMSKAFGAAGLRLGYMAACQQIVDQVRIVRLPYHLSALTQAAARACLAHRGELAEQIALLRTERDKLQQALVGYGLDVIPSDANFILFGTFADRHAIWEGLVERGILIREVGPAGMLRVSVGTPKENVAFLSALKEVM